MVYNDDSGDNKTKGLLGKGDINFVSQIIISRDESNNGMGRAEVINTIMDISETANPKAAENHLDYLIRTKQIAGVKRNGRVTTAQKTSIKRSQITVEQQLRWHGTVDAVLEEQTRLNQPSAEFDEVKEHFVGNFDEACLLGSDGTVKVLASEGKTKTEKIMDDCRASITTLRAGMSSGDQGPFIFLAAGQHIERKSLKNLPSFRKGVPSGSKVIMTPNAFMNNEVYLEIAPILAKGIRDMPVICEHPDWWVVMSLDGFGSHCNVHEAQQVFADHKIFIIKEEGDTSHVNQPYDQSVAKNDKTGMRYILELMRSKVGPMRMDQWYLIAFAIEAQLKVERQSWIDSFKKVNLHPKYRVSSAKWIKILDRRGSLVSGEKFFEKRTSLYDAMPVCWKNLPVEKRHSVIRIIKEIYDSAVPDEPVWTTKSVKELRNFVSLPDIVKLRGCYLASKHDPSVIVGGYDNDNNQNDTAAQPDPTQPNIDDFFHWRPTSLVNSYREDRTDKKEQKVFFNHITNYVAESHWDVDKEVTPSPYLEAAISATQRKLLNPTHKEMLRGFILYDVKGAGAKEKIAKRRLDMIEGNVSSYSRCLNNPLRLNEIKDLNQLTATVAQISADQDEEKARRKAEAERKEIDKNARKELNQRKEATKKAEKMPELQPIMGNIEAMTDADTRRSSLRTLTLAKLREIIRFYFDAKPKGLQQMTKDNLVQEIMGQMEDE